MNDAVLVDNLAITIGTSSITIMSPVEVNGRAGVLNVRDAHASQTVTVKLLQSAMAAPGDPTSNPTNWTQIGSDTVVSAAGGKSALAYQGKYRWISATALASGAATTPVDVTFCAFGV